MNKLAQLDKMKELARHSNPAALVMARGLAAFLLDLDPDGTVRHEIAYDLMRTVGFLPVGTIGVTPEGVQQVQIPGEEAETVMRWARVAFCKICHAGESVGKGRQVPEPPQPHLTQETLENMICELWQKCIDCATDYGDVPVDVVQKLIADTRKVASDAGWPAEYTHNFFVGLRRVLASVTAGHPTTQRIINMLEIETEFD